MIRSLVYTKQAQKDVKKLAASGLKKKAKDLLALIETDPFQNPPPYKRLVGNLAGTYSRRINIQYRLVYQVLEEEHIFFRLPRSSVGAQSLTLQRHEPLAAGAATPAFPRWSVGTSKSRIRSRPPGY